MKLAFHPRRMLLAVIALLAWPALAGAQICGGCVEGGNSSIPSCIRLVGRDALGVPDPAGAFLVVVRDLANNPMPNVLVRVDLSPAPDMQLCPTQAPGLVVSAAPGAMYVEGRTDASGVFSASIVGGSNGAGGAVTLLNGGRIYADGVLLGSPTVSAFDLDGSGGVGINDLSVWLGDFGAIMNYGRSDYDCSGALGVNDLSVWLMALGSGRSLASCSP